MIYIAAVTRSELDGLKNSQDSEVGKIESKSEL